MKRVPHINVVVDMPRTEVHADSHQDDDIVLGEIGFVQPRVPDDVYRFGFLRWEKGRVGDRDRYFFYFKIVEGPYFGNALFYSCPFPRNAEKNKIPKFGPSSNLIKAYVVAMGQRPPRRDRFSTKVFRGKYFLARTRTVKKGSGKDDPIRPEQDWYSVIDRLVSKEAGG